jgi:hypothetical protein
VPFAINPVCNGLVCLREAFLVELADEFAGLITCLKL